MNDKEMSYSYLGVVLQIILRQEFRLLLMLKSSSKKYLPISFSRWKFFIRKYFLFQKISVYQRESSSSAVRTILLLLFCAQNLLLLTTQEARENCLLTLMPYSKCAVSTVHKSLDETSWPLEKQWWIDGRWCLAVNSGC